MTCSTLMGWVTLLAGHDPTTPTSPTTPGRRHPILLVATRPRPRPSAWTRTTTDGRRCETSKCVARVDRIRRGFRARCLAHDGVRVRDRDLGGERRAASRQGATQAPQELRDRPAPR